jgi:AAA domain, putative AbiEii toxin, Type IV TA system
MIYRLEIENFYSIRDRQVIDLRVARNTPDDDGRLAPIWPGAAERAPKIAAFFGPNASGKSNVLKALPFLAWFLSRSFQAPPETLAQFYSRFQDDVMPARPSRLAFEFSGPADPAGIDTPDAQACGYAYEVTLSGAGTEPLRVLNETLTYRPSGAARNLRLFARDQDGHVRAGRAFGLAEYGMVLDKVVRPNASVVSTLAALNHPFSIMLAKIEALVRTNIFVDGHEVTDSAIVQYYASNAQHLKRLNREIARLDLGVCGISVQPVGNGVEMFFDHAGLSAPLSRRSESHGTWQFVELFPMLIQALDSGGIAIVDELDLALHPFVLPEILRWFRDPQRNPSNAQLWASCQNASMLEDLSKEEVYFCKKNEAGSTQIYGLRDILSVRRDDNYYRKYLGGVYGAVPLVA